MGDRPHLSANEDVPLKYPAMHPPKALFLSHGGGPLPLLGDAGHREMVACLETIAARIPRPAALLVVSAHWEAPVPTLTAGANPPLIHDYSGFPEEAYSIRYPCAGDPSLASRVHGLLEHAGFEARLDASRGFDHGLFVPLKILYPAADIPCVQLSLVDGLDPFRHVELGRALESLYRDEVLVIGSGFSFHNLRAFFTAVTDESRALNHAFEQWLMETCSRPDLSGEERAHRLIHWPGAPGARYCHPREEHLLPLHVCYGVAGTQCSERFGLTSMNRESSMYLW